MTDFEKIMRPSVSSDNDVIQLIQGGGVVPGSGGDADDDGA